MDREVFDRLVAEALASIPSEFQKRLENIVVLVEDRPAIRRKLQRPGHREKLVLGVFEGVPRTMKSVFDLRTGPDRIVLYQRNIEAICRDDAEIREQIRLTVIHELGHYFGMDEDQLKDV
jgi:predicted Zn-dependent protease with MMP-like domain